MLKIVFDALLFCVKHTRHSTSPSMFFFAMSSSHMLRERTNSNSTTPCTFSVECFAVFMITPTPPPVRCFSSASVMQSSDWYYSIMWFNPDVLPIIQYLVGWKIHSWKKCSLVVIVPVGTIDSAHLQSHQLPPIVLFSVLLVVHAEEDQSFYWPKNLTHNHGIKYE